jgi:hypothetical protein
MGSADDERQELVVCAQAFEQAVARRESRHTASPRRSQLAMNAPGLLHLMRAVVASRIMRTTIDLDATVVKELKRRSKDAGKSMGQFASELLARSLSEQAGRPRNPDGLMWIAKDLGQPSVDLDDKEAVRARLDSRQ